MGVLANAPFQRALFFVLKKESERTPELHNFWKRIRNQVGADGVHIDAVDEQLPTAFLLVDGIDTVN